MRRRYWARWCVLVLLFWAAPIALSAQEDDSGEQEVSAEEESAVEDADGETEPDADGPVEDGAGTADEELDAQSDGDGAEDGDVAGGDEIVDEEPVTEDDGVAGDEEIADDDVVEGPGGAPLQTDYPGTEESLQARMDTGRIEGEELPEGEEGEEIYDLRVRELETQIDDLKERVFRSKSRIALLRETVLAENLAGSRAVVTFVNDLGRRYKIDRAIFSVDGSQVHSTLGTNGEYDEETEIFSGPMTPGTHTVSVTLGLTGSGYGLFSYAEGYEFDLRFSCQFTAEEGRTTLVTVRSYKSGNSFTAHEERPDGICKVSMVELDIEDFEDEVEDLDAPELE